MPTVFYSPSEFPESYGTLLQHPQELALSWSEIVWAAITVGRAELAHVLRYGYFSFFEISYRVAILFANLRELDAGGIGRSDAYDGLDPSEKSAISYFLGMAFTKAAVHRLCSVPWLMHFDVYGDDLGVELGTRRRPDLVGQDLAGRWVVVESKGRTNGFDERALRRATEQVKQEMTIDGSVPHLRIGSLVHFDHDRLQLHLEDPRVRSGEAVKIPLTSESLLDGYYSRFRWFTRDPARRVTEVDGRVFSEVSAQHLDLSVGIDSDIDALTSPGRIREVGEREWGFMREGAEALFIGADGVLVRLGDLWSSDNMRRQPRLRAQTVAAR